MSPQQRYYDLDAILAEEELIPCRAQFDFSFLAHLDPDHDNNQNNYNNGSDRGSGHGHYHDHQYSQKQQQQQQHYLPEQSLIQMPLWAVPKRAELGYIELTLPKHYTRKARERLEAEPAQVNLRKRNNRFFMTGRNIVDLMETSSARVKAALEGSNRRRSSGSGRVDRHSIMKQLQAVEQVQRQAQELRHTLRLAYTGERLRRSLNWAMSSLGDDVSSLTNSLTVMELRLFQAGAAAAFGQWQWLTFGNPRFIPPKRQQPPAVSTSRLSKQQLSDRLQEHTSRKDHQGTSSKTNTGHKRRRVS